MLSSRKSTRPSKKPDKYRDKDFLVQLSSGDEAEEDDLITPLIHPTGRTKKTKITPELSEIAREYLSQVYLERFQNGGSITTTIGDLENIFRKGGGEPSKAQCSAYLTSLRRESELGSAQIGN
jgi:hypothetical protein